MAFHSIHWYSLAFQGISRHSKTFQGISRHSKTFQGIPSHSKAFLGLPRVIQGVPREVVQSHPKTSKVVQRHPKSFQRVPRGSKGSKWFHLCLNGAGVLRTGTYTYGDLRFLWRYARGPTRSRGARCWPKASS